MEKLRIACTSFTEAKAVLKEVFELNRWTGSSGKTGVYIDILEEQYERFKQIWVYRKSWEMVKLAKINEVQISKIKEKKEKKQQQFIKPIITNSKEKIYRSYHVSPWSLYEYILLFVFFD